jgi:hypothetical protein
MKHNLHTWRQEEFCFKMELTDADFASTVILECCLKRLGCLLLVQNWVIINIGQWLTWYEPRGFLLYQLILQLEFDWRLDISLVFL